MVCNTQMLIAELILYIWLSTKLLTMVVNYLLYRILVQLLVDVIRSGMTYIFIVISVNLMISIWKKIQIQSKSETID